MCNFYELNWTSWEEQERHIFSTTMKPHPTKEEFHALVHTLLPEAENHCKEKFGDAWPSGIFKCLIEILGRRGFKEVDFPCSVTFTNVVNGQLTCKTCPSKENPECYF